MHNLQRREEYFKLDCHHRSHLPLLLLLSSSKPHLLLWQCAIEFYCSLPFKRRMFWQIHYSTEGCSCSLCLSYATESVCTVYRFTSVIFLGLPLSFSLLGEDTVKAQSVHLPIHLGLAGCLCWWTGYHYTSNKLQCLTASFQISLSL